MAGAERNRCFDQGETTDGQREATTVQTALKRGCGMYDVCATRIHEWLRKSDASREVVDV